MCLMIIFKFYKIINLFFKMKEMSWQYVATDWQIEETASPSLLTVTTGILSHCSKGLNWLLVKWNWKMDF